MVKNLPDNAADAKTWVQSLGQEDPLEEEWQPTLVFLPRQSHGQRSLVGYSLYRHRESDTTEHNYYSYWYCYHFTLNNYPYKKA